MMRTIVALLALLVHSALTLTSLAAGQRSLGSIRGIVIESNVRNRIPFAVVLAVGERKGAMTDESGGFVISNLSPGEHRIRARSMGFEDKDTTVLVVPDTEVQIVLRMSEKGSVIVDDFGIVPDFTSAIWPAQPSPLHVGDQPRFQVEIRNRSSDAVWLVRSPNGLAHNNGYPETSITIDGPAGGYEPISSQPSDLRPMSLDDLAEVPAHQSFDPFHGTVTLPGKFRNSGHYVATFHYSVNLPGVRQTRGYPGWPADVLKRIQEVPWLDLHSSASFEVLP
jgi:hypothetical protein